MIYHNFSMQFKNNSAGRRSSRVRTAKKKQLSGKEEERDRSRYGKVHDAGDVCVCLYLHIAIVLGICRPQPNRRSVSVPPLVSIRECRLLDLQG